MASPQAMAMSKAMLVPLTDLEWDAASLTWTGQRRRGPIRRTPVARRRRRCQDDERVVVHRVAVDPELAGARREPEQQLGVDGVVLGSVLDAQQRRVGAEETLAESDAVVLAETLRHDLVDARVEAEVEVGTVARCNTRGNVQL